MTVVKLRLDLGTVPGRRAMRAYLDALDEGCAPERRSTIETLATPIAPWVPTAPFGPAPDIAGGEQSAGEDEFAPGDDDDEGATFGEIAAEIYGLVAAPAPEPGAAAEPTPPAPAAAPVDPAPEAMGGGDPGRPWTDALRREVWRLREGGMRQSDVARRVGLKPMRVYNYLADISRGKRRPPAEDPVRTPAETSTAVVPVAPAGRALAIVERRPAQDEGMRAQRLDEMAAAEREKAVARSLYPEMTP